MKTLSTTLLLIISTFISLNAQTIMTVNPDTGYRGYTVRMNITGNGTDFIQGSGTSVDVYFRQGSQMYMGTNTVASSDTELMTSFHLDSYVNYGLYDVITNVYRQGSITKSAGFEVLEPSISSYSPDTIYVGRSNSLTILGRGTRFSQGSNTAAQAYIRNGSVQIGAQQDLASSNTELTSTFLLQATATLGLWDLVVDVFGQGSFTANKKVVVIDPSVSVSDKTSKSKSLIYPNPAKNSIHFTSDVSGYNFQLLSIEGKKITEGLVEGNSIDVSELNKGTYIVIIDGATHKFLKD